MPPRRSCFFLPQSRPRVFVVAGFNATTAFLLPSVTMTKSKPFIARFNATTAFLLRIPNQRGPRRRDRVSMPPRRSCFRFATSLEERGFARFQCHHGVPASGRFCCRGDLWAPGVSMPPRRSCFPSTSAGESDAQHAFQCHHGVPASSLMARSPSFFACFNATTAFLLPPSHLRRMEGFGDVSMPPRRSYFRSAPASAGS